LRCPYTHSQSSHKSNSSKDVYLRRTLPPLNQYPLLKGHRSIIVRKLSGSRTVGGSKCNAIVDVEESVCAARRPNGRRIIRLIGLGIDGTLIEAAPFDGRDDVGL